MHILILPSHLYQTAYMPLQGIFQRHQAECLASAGHSAGVLSVGLLPFKCILKENPFSKPLAADENGVAVVRRYDRAMLPQRFMKPSALAGATVRLGLEAYERYVRLHGVPDVLHAHDCLYAGVLAAELKSRYGIPYVITEHSSAHGRGLYNAQQEGFIRRAMQEATVITAVGSSSAKLLEKKYGADISAAGRVTVLYNLLESSFENSGLPAPKHDGNGFTFLNVANLVRLKNHRNLIRAFATVRRAHPEARLRIGGEGPERQAIEKAVAAEGLGGCVSLLGRLGRAQVQQEMADCDAFALSSDIETFGVVLIEAMAMGRPVVATACGGPADIVDDRCGYLVPVNDADALGAAMIRMIENHANFSSENIRRHCVERFGRDAFLGRLERVYRDALSSESAIHS